MQAPEPKVKDEQLILLLHAEQTREQGFRLLMELYQERLYLHIRRMVGGHEDANDVLQNCLLKVLRNVDNFKGKSALYTWLYRIATNEALNHLKKQQRRMVSSLSAEAALTSEHLRADAWMDGEQVQEQLQRAMAKLPDRQRQVFIMRYYDELSYQEMSDILQTSVGGLKASYHHAVKKIEKYLINAMG